jgi:4-hydroxy-tetrahydrodipicolinate reductase
MIRIALCGALGRMGHAIVEAVAQQNDMSLTSAIEAPNHPGLGSRINSIGVVSSLEAVIATSDIVVDFTNPATTINHAILASNHKRPFVTGTTGLSNEQLAALHTTSKAIPMVVAPNMSVGVNLLYRLVENASKILGDDFDVEIVEMHHRFKKDAPSGTAARLADVLAKSKEGSAIIYGRKGMIGERPRKEIGVHALRGGDVVGEHTVIFAGLGERLEITHKAHSRATFANGVVRAIRFVMDKSPGIYTMADVLGLA